MIDEEELEGEPDGTVIGFDYVLLFGLCVFIWYSGKLLLGIS